ncbi:type II secretion system F family protein [Actinomadura scrupuli]|uniref:type II secretion system F family protein n=1 Tax=Actinomadura scrupuli TaxID=559629 RepID=UPI003D969444
MIAVAVAAGVIAVPQVIAGHAARDRIARLEGLEQWTRRLADLLAAGRALEQALQQSASRNVPTPIAEPVRALARRINVSRMPTEQALRDFAQELDDPVADRITAALILVAWRRGTGGSKVLAALAELVARDIGDRREVEAARAEHRTTVRWVIAILAVLTTVAVLQRSYVQPFGTRPGRWCWPWPRPATGVRCGGCTGSAARTRHHGS